MRPTILLVSILSSVSCQRRAPLPLDAVCARSSECEAGLGCLEGRCSLPTEENGVAVVGGTINGLRGGGLVLGLGDEQLAPTGNGPFQFQTALGLGMSYQVSVVAQPSNPAQVCTLANASGVVVSRVDDVTVTCVTVTRTLTGTVSGAAAAVTVTGPSGEQVVQPDGTVSFTADDGTAFTLSVSSPAGQACGVLPAAGTLNADTSFAVICLNPTLPWFTNTTRFLEWVEGPDRDNRGAAIEPFYDGVPDGPRGAIHAGVSRYARVPGLTQCAEVTVRDQLGAFRWRCREESGAIVLSSWGFEDHKHLSSLIDFATTVPSVLSADTAGAGAFLPNAVIIETPKGSIQTPASVWWADSFKQQSSGACSGVAFEPDNQLPILLIKSGCASVAFGYRYDNGYALVVQPGLTVDAQGSWSFPGGGVFWLEGSFRGATTAFSALDYAVFDNVEVRGFTGDGIVVSGVQGVSLRDVRGSVASTLVNVTGGARHNRFENITGSASYSTLEINQSSHYNEVRNLRSFSSNYFGLVILGSSVGGGTPTRTPVYSNIVAGALSANDGNAGTNTGVVWIQDADGTHVQDITVMNTEDIAGFKDRMSVRPNSLHQALIMNNAQAGVYFGSGFGLGQSSQLQLRRVLVAAGGTGYAGDSTGVTLGNDLYASGNTVACSATGGGFCAALSSPALNASTVFETLPEQQALFSGIDWFTALPEQGFWGPAGGLFTRGPCASGTCQLYSARLAPTAPAFVRGAVTLPQQAFSFAYVGLTDAQACARLGGAVVGGDCVTSVLEAAVELDRDGVGNDNLLCQSGERCVISRNLGVYQGEGEPRFVDTITRGGAANVALFEYPL